MVWPRPAAHTTEPFDRLVCTIQAQLVVERALFACLTVVFCACGGGDRPPPLADQIDPDIPGDDGASGGAAGSNQVGSAGGANNAGGAGNGTGELDPLNTVGVWDPLQVYLYGSLASGVSCDYRVIANVNTPDSYITGFPCEAPVAPALHDGKLYYVYQLDRTLRLFVPDTSSDSAPNLSSYPETPAVNDDVIPTAGCTGVYEIMASPDGFLSYNCGIGQTWFVMETDEVLLDDGSALLALGNDGIALLGALPLDPGTHRVQVLPGGPVTVITGLPEDPDNSIAAVRSHEDGFRLAIRLNPIEAPVYHELWQVSGAGVATLVGPLELPSDVNEADIRGGLEPDGAFLKPINIGNDRGIYRINTDGEGGIAYEATESFLKWGAQRMITGP